MASRFTHAYHLPPLGDNTTSQDREPDSATKACIDRIYVDQQASFDFEVAPDHKFMPVYPTEQHPNAPHPYDICGIFNEGEQTSAGNPARNIYEFHRDWRQVLDVTTILVAYQEVVTYRPIFATAFSCFTACDIHDGVTIKRVWAFFSLLLDIVLESLSIKLLSGDSSTNSVCQHAEQILLGIGFGVQPIVDLYHHICTSEMFSRLVNRISLRNIGLCTFTSMADIVADDGGLYLYYLVKNFLVCANAAIARQLERDSLVVMESYDICGLRFPKSYEYQMLLWSELQNLAFNPFINDLFLPSTMTKELLKLLRNEYLVVAPARIRLYCCTGVRMLTGSLFNTLTYDAIAHGYFKRHCHLSFTAEIFSLASTIIMFRLHAIRTGFLAGRPIPIIDPRFSMRGADGEFSQIFLQVWAMHADTLRHFGKMELGIPGLDFPFEGPSVSGATGNLTPDTPSPTAVRKQRSMVDLALGYLNRAGDKPAGSTPSVSPAGASPAAVGAPFGSTLPATSSAPCVHGPFPSVRVALQEFSKVCRLQEEPRGLLRR